MKRVYQISLILLIIVAGVLASSCSKPQGGAPAASSSVAPPIVDRQDYYPLTEGSQWVYENVTPMKDGKSNSKSVVTYQVRGKEIVENTICDVVDIMYKGKKIHTMYFQVNKDGVFIIKRITMDGKELRQAPQQTLKFPLEAGVTWMYQDPAGLDKDAYSYKVVGQESVETPAGKFDCMKLEIDRAGAAGGLVVTSNQWYAKGVGMVKEESPGVGSSTLKSFDLAPKPPEPTK